MRGAAEPRTQRDALTRSRVRSRTAARVRGSAPAPPCPQCFSRRSAAVGDDARDRADRHAGAARLETANAIAECCDAWPRMSNADGDVPHARRGERGCRRTCLAHSSPPDTHRRAAGRRRPPRPSPPARRPGPARSTDSCRSARSGKRTMLSVSAMFAKGCEAGNSTTPTSARRPRSPNPHSAAPGATAGGFEALEHRRVELREAARGNPLRHSGQCAGTRLSTWTSASSSLRPISRARMMSLRATFHAGEVVARIRLGVAKRLRLFARRDENAWLPSQCLNRLGERAREDTLDPTDLVTGLAQVAQRLDHSAVRRPRWPRTGSASPRAPRFPSCARSSRRRRCSPSCSA